MLWGKINREIISKTSHLLWQAHATSRSSSAATKWRRRPTSTMGLRNCQCMNTRMLGVQFLASCLSQSHPSYATVTAPPGARKKKSVTLEDAYPAIRSVINTSYVSRAFASRSDYQLPTSYLHFHHKATPANSEDSFSITFGILNQTGNLLLSRWPRDIRPLSRLHGSAFLCALQIALPWGL